MKIFNDFGITALTNLKHELEKLLIANAAPTESQPIESKSDATKLKSYSEYSNTLIDTVIAIINMLLNNNDIKDWKSEKKQNELRTLLDKLDLGKKTYVPDVFNDQSYQLAQKLLANISSEKLNNYLNDNIKTAVSALIGPIEKFIGVLTSSLQYKIKFYELLLQNTNSLDFYEMKQAFAISLTNKWGAQLERVTPEEFDAFKNDYTKQLKELLEQAKIASYVKVLGKHQQPIRPDSQLPYKFDELSSIGNRAILAWSLLSLESQFNNALKDRGQMVTVAYDIYNTAYSTAEKTRLEDELTHIGNSLIAEIEEYAKGKHLRSIQKLGSTWKEKKVLAQNEINFIKEQLKPEKRAQLYPSTGMRSFEIFEELNKTLKKNNEIAAKNKRSPGELSKLLAKYAEKFFILSVCKGNETNDSGIRDRLNGYEDAFPVLKKSMTSTSSTVTGSAPTAPIRNPGVR